MESTTNWTGTTAGLAALTVFCSSLHGEELSVDPGVDWKYPLVYSAGLMAVYFPVLWAADVFDSGPSINNFERAFTSAPQWDDDSAVFNFVLHPLWGSETYLRAREARFGIPGSIAFSVGMSVTWEYLIESWVEQPSTQDLIFTTGIGWGIGELRYQLKQRSSERMDWLIDPIETTLEHVRVVVARTPEGKTAAQFTFAFRF